MHCLAGHHTSYLAKHLHHRHLGHMYNMPIFHITIHGQVYKACRAFPDNLWISILVFVQQLGLRLSLPFRNIYMSIHYCYSWS